MTETNEKELFEEHITEKTYIFKVKKCYPDDKIWVTIRHNPEFRNWYGTVTRIGIKDVTIPIGSAERESSLKREIENKIKGLFNIEGPMLEHRIEELEKEKQSLKDGWDETEARLLEWIDKCTEKTKKIKELKEENKLLKYAVKIAGEQLSGKSNVKVTKLIVKDKEIRL